MTKHKCEGKGRYAIITMSGETNHHISGYCRHCCSVYMFNAYLNNEASESGINGGHIRELCIVCVEEADKILKRKAANYHDNDWKTQSEINNDPQVCSAIISQLERLAGELFYEQVEVPK